MTAETNTEQEHSVDTDPLPMWSRALVVITVTTFIIMSNITNIVVLRRIGGIPRIAKICLINLSLADLAVGAITCFLSVLPAFLGTWPYGDVVCQISGVVHGSSVTMSIWTLSLISVDRYIALVHSFKYRVLVSVKRVAWAIVVLWLIAIATFLAPLPSKSGFIYYQYSRWEVMCGLYWEYAWFCIITGAGIPLVAALIIVVTTARIALMLFKVNKSLTSSQEDSLTARRRKRDLKAVRTLVVTALMFFVFWGPYVTNVLLYSFDKTIRAPREAEFAFVWMANSNSFINVVIYSFLYRNFRNEVRSLAVRVFACCRFRPIENSAVDFRLDSQLSFSSPI